MESGDRMPKLNGNERAGTRLFMALDLLRHQEVVRKRRNGNNLESFAWQIL